MIEFNIDLAQVIGLLLGVVLPLLVGLVTKRTTNSGLKAALLAGLALVSNLLTELLASINAGTPFDLGTALITGLGAFVVAVSVHYGLLKPTGVSASVQAVGSKE